MGENANGTGSRRLPGYSCHSRLVVSIPVMPADARSHPAIGDRQLGVKRLYLAALNKSRTVGMSFTGIKP
jgi:hypothetical protein